MNEAQPNPNNTITYPTKNSGEQSIKAWIEQQVKDSDIQYLLAHCEDGIVWGTFNQAGTLITSFDIAKACPQPKLPPFAQLRPETLWMVRLFGPTNEIRLWKADDIWHAVCVKDADDPEACIEEQQFVWGTDVQAQHDGWSLMSDGRQGFYQWVPKHVPRKDKPYAPTERPLRLTIHHTINYDDHGRAYIAYSRLVNLDAPGE